MKSHGSYNFTHGLKKHLLKEGIKVRRCESCGLTEWGSVLIPLELHHANGVNNDHRLSNLQLLCPDCHALTDSYRDKNQNRKNS